MQIIEICLLPLDKFPNIGQFFGCLHLLESSVTTNLVDDRELTLTRLGLLSNLMLQVVLNSLLVLDLPFSLFKELFLLVKLLLDELLRLFQLIEFRVHLLILLMLRLQLLFDLHSAMLGVIQ